MSPGRRALHRNDLQDKPGYRIAVKEGVPWQRSDKEALVV